VESHRVTHSQLVPTMFSRMLKVKEQMIAWWGPIVHEYYGMTAGMGITACDSTEWLGHRGYGRPRRVRRSSLPGRGDEPLPDSNDRYDMVQA
jgi:hypothetical protein